MEIILKFLVGGMIIGSFLGALVIEIILIFIGFQVSKKAFPNSEGMKALTVVISAIIFPLSYKLYSSYQEVTKKDALAQSREAYDNRRATYKNNLIKACNTESKITINKKIPKNSGFFLASNFESDRSFDSVLEKNAAGNFVNILPKQPDITKSQAFENCLKQLDDEHKGDKHYIPRSDSWGACAGQYKYPVQWTQDLRLSEGVAKSLETSFIETSFEYSHDGDRDWIKKEFPNNSQSPNFYRLGTKKWWEQAGLKDFATRWTDKFIAHMHFDNLKPDDYVQNSIPVDKVMAKYSLSAQDISTLEDRQKGIRRGALRLKDINTNQILAEYIGFDIAPNIDREGTEHSEFNCLNVNPTTSANSQSKQDSSGRYDSQEVYKYFITNVVEK